jgi:hypothetical protein
MLRFFLAEWMGWWLLLGCCFIWSVWLAVSFLSCWLSAPLRNDRDWADLVPHSHPSMPLPLSRTVIQVPSLWHEARIFSSHSLIIRIYSILFSCPYYDAVMRSTLLDFFSSNLLSDSIVSPSFIINCIIDSLHLTLLFSIVSFINPYLCCICYHSE